MSVRGLIVLVVVIGVALGWVVEAARIQRHAVAAIRRDGGLVSYDWELKGGKWDGHSWQTDGRPGVPKWLFDCLGVDYFDYVVSIALSQPASDSTLHHIAQLNRVERVDFHGTCVTDAWLSPLKELANLSHLDLGDRYSDCVGPVNLRDKARVTDAGMPYLEGLSKLTFLDLNGTRVSNAGLVHLAGLTKLETLRLCDSLVTDAGLTHFAGMTKLKGLGLGGTAITDAGVAHLKHLTTLCFLDLSGTQITDAGLADVGRLTNLAMLDLSNTRITDAGLADLKGLPRLWDLNLCGTRVTRAGVREIELASPIDFLQVQLKGEDRR